LAEVLLPIHLEQRAARIGKSRIYYETGGEGPAVVLLHGLCGSSRWWVKNTAVLAGRFRVFVIDLIGFGRSHGQRFVLEETAGLIGAWMEQTGIPCFHLVGHSMGGLVAAELAAQRPGQVDRLVLVDVAALPPGRTIPGSALRLFPAVVYMPLDFLPVLVTDALRAGPLTLLRATYAIHQARLTADLAQVAGRTLIVWGEHDMLLPAAGGRALHEGLAGSQFAMLRGAGHNPMWDRAKEFNRIVMDFLAQ
jgi:pimeloyl-ACP methyl ester carboxylesterase